MILYCMYLMYIIRVIMQEYHHTLLYVSHVHYESNTAARVITFPVVCVYRMYIIRVLMYCMYLMYIIRVIILQE